MTGKIAPYSHVGEIEAVLKGEKPFAVTNSFDKPELFRQFVEAGRTIPGLSVRRLGINHRGDYSMDAVLFRRGEDNYADAYLDLLKYGVGRHGLAEYQARMGHLLGYTQEDTDTFVSQFASGEFKCDCHMCNGL